MREGSEKILKQALLEQIEQELSAVPSEEEMRRLHVFSERFETGMSRILRGNRTAAEDVQEKSPGGKAESEENNKSAAQKRIFFKRRRTIRILAACVACFLIAGISLKVVRDGVFLRKGSSSGAADIGGAAEETGEMFGTEDSLYEEDDPASGGSSDTESAAPGQESMSEDAETGDLVYMVRLDGRLYVDTGETSGIGRCGVMDFTLDSSVEAGVPTEEGQTNFGIGYSGQRGMRENRIEICINEVWHIFAWQENDLEDVSLSVKKGTDVSAEITLVNRSDREYWYDDTYSLERLDEDIDTWVYIPEIGEYAYHDLAYSVTSGGTAEWSVDWSGRYGQLEAGTYRIVKTIYEDTDESEDSAHTMMAEFEID